MKKYDTTTFLDIWVLEKFLMKSQKILHVKILFNYLL